MVPSVLFLLELEKLAPLVLTSAQDGAHYDLRVRGGDMFLGKV